MPKKEVAMRDSYSVSLPDGMGRIIPKKEYSLAYDIVAQMFYRDTALMAPGKDSMSPIAGVEIFEKWKEENKNHCRAVYDVLTSN